MTPIYETAINSASAAVAAAAAHAQKGAAALARAQERRSRIEGRIQGLEGKRAAIIARRARGQHEADDAGTLALLDADLVGLKELVAEADAAVAAARAPAESAQQAASAARLMLDRTQAEATEAALVAHAVTLDGLLLETIKQIADASARIGRPQMTWKPSDALAGALRRIMAARGML